MKKYIWFLLLVFAGESSYAQDPWWFNLPRYDWAQPMAWELAGSATEWLMDIGSDRIKRATMYYEPPTVTNEFRAGDIIIASTDEFVSTPYILSGSTWKPFGFEADHYHVWNESPAEPVQNNATFTTEFVFSPNTLQVFYNGVMYRPGVDYNEANNKQGFSFIAPLRKGRVEVHYIKDPNSS